MTERIALTDMETGEKGIVVDFLGGQAAQDRLRALGIRPGIKVAKVSSAFARGPVVVQAGGSQTELGFGISSKVVVEVER